MGHLELRFEKQNLGGDVDLGVVARVRQIKDAAGRYPAEPEDREIVIPAGVHATKKVNDIPPGTYRIEARLPSGEVLRETREISDSGEPVEVVFRTDHSPHDWLSWQRFAGNVPSQKEYENWISDLAQQIVRSAKAKEDAAKPIEIDPVVIQGWAKVARGIHLKVQPVLKSLSDIAAKIGGELISTTVSNQEAPGPEPAPPPATAEFELLQVDPQKGEQLWDAVVSLPAWTAWRQTAQAHDGCVANRRDDRNLTLWRIDQVDRTRRVTIASGESVPVRCLAVLRRGDGIEVLMLPVPWPLHLDDPPAGLEVLREAGTSASGRTTVTVRDNLVGSLLMYLGNGKMGEAATVLAAAAKGNLIDDLVSDKARNPLAACAAAYIGLATLSDDAEPPRWAAWLENFKSRFVWLPDGAIIQAAYLLKTARSRDDLDRARDVLKDAYRRGIPFYTVGFRHLTNGLYTFADEDPEAKTMHKAISAVGLRVDPNQTFNQITIGA